MRKEMNEMEMNEVTGGMIFISNLLFNKNQKMDIEDAIFDSKKEINIENAILDSKERARFIPLNKERRTTIMSAMVC